MDGRIAIALLALASALFPGCACSTNMGPPDGGTDAAGPSDDVGSAWDASDEGGIDAGPSDGGMDVSIADLGLNDSGVDAGSCAEGCASANPCEVSSCNDSTGLCELTSLADGVICGELDMALCMHGMCVARGCGDGFREPGSELWPREGCDDGNAQSGDTCSDTCEPTEFVVQADLGTEEFHVRLAADGHMLVFDGLGNGLLVWVERYFGIGESRQELRASRIDSGGNFLDLDEPFAVDATTNTTFDVTPSAVGLSTGGFVVAWTARRTVQGAPRNVLLMRRITPTGVMTSQVNVHPPMDGDQRWPRLAALSDSFVVVWEDAVPNVWGRRFRNTGTAVTTVMPLASTTAGRQLRPRVAAQGDAWMVTFLSQAVDVSSPVQVRGRRFLESGPLGNDFSIVAAHAMTHELTALGESYLLTYTSREFDNRGDLYSMAVPRSSGAFGTPLPLDTNLLTGAANPQVAQYGPRGQGGYIVVYNDNEVGLNPLFVTVNISPPSEVETLRILMRGEDWAAVAAAPYTLTGGSAWFAYSAQVTSSRLGAVVFQLPPP